MQKTLIVVLFMTPLLLAALTSCDNVATGNITSKSSDPTLTVKFELLDPQSLERMISVCGFDLNISYTGSADAAELFFDVYRDGERVINKMSAGGIGGFPAVNDLTFHQRILMLDLENGPLQLNSQEGDQKPFYRFLNSATWTRQEPSGGESKTTGGPGFTAIPKSYIDFSDGMSNGAFHEFDVTQAYIPIAWIRKSINGRLSSRPPMRQGKLDLETVEGSGYIIIYLSLRRDVRTKGEL